MKTRHGSHLLEIAKYWKCAFLLAIVLLVPSFAAVPATTAGSSHRVQPELQQVAARQPRTPVRVIVQKLVQDTSLEDMLPSLGGVVVQDLSIINAFVAELPAKAAVQLAQAPGVQAVLLDAPVVQTGTPAVSAANLTNAYVKAIRADKVWTQTSGNYQGQGIGVAIVDSGITPQLDFYTKLGKDRVTAAVGFNGGSNPGLNQTLLDGFGHGNHVAGIVGGNGWKSGGAYIGVAPMVNLINVKVSDDQGGATVSNVVTGLQWILNNKDKYNIRVVNISLNESSPTSYHKSPLNAAVEILWFNKIVVVVSAGNHGQQGALYAPANDPFVITVGATDDKGTPSITDDTIASFSAYGKTVDGVVKPDLVAPGKNIVSVGAPASVLGQQHPSHVVNNDYFRMSGTSMSAPMVSAAAALILQANPSLTPDQVKHRLMATAVKNTAAWPGYNAAKAGAGYLDVYAAVTGTTTASANTGIAASKLLWSGSQPLTWSSANWNSANWNSANWNSANWNSANWNSANWNSDYWGD